MSFFFSLVERGRSVSACCKKIVPLKFPFPCCVPKVGQRPFSSFPLARFSPSVCLLLLHIAHTSALILHSSCTHLSFICHSSVTHRKKKKNEEEKYSPHTPYKKKKIKEEEKPNILPYVRILGRERSFSANFSKSEGAFG